jgi:hypothetical protein
MKPLAIFICIFLGFLSELAAQPKQEIHINALFRNLSFDEFVAELESSYPVHFFYEDNWIKSIKVNIDARQLTVPDLMERLLLPTMLDYIYQPPGNIYILPNKKFVKSLPEYFLPKSGQDSVVEKQNEYTGMEEKYLRGRQPDMIKTIVIGSRDKVKKGRLAAITRTPRHRKYPQRRHCAG